MNNNPYIAEKTKLIRITPETAIDSTFTISWDKPVNPGQFLQISIPGAGEAPISISDFCDGELSMTIRKVGRVTGALFDLKEGDALYVRGPYGNGFDYSDYEGKDIKIIAGGTGLAPVKNLVKTFMEPRYVNSLEVLLGFKTPEDILFKNEVLSWVESGTAILTVDNGSEGWKGNSGLITQYIPQLDLEKPEECVCIVVGPPVMIKFVLADLLTRDIPRDNIWVSFERNMSCGIGKCGHCKIDDTYVCLDGPVFRLPDTIKMID